MESPLIDTLKSVSVLGVEWTIEEVKSMVFTFIRAAKVLEKFIISKDTLKSPDSFMAVIETEESGKIYSILYQKKEFEFSR